MPTRTPRPLSADPADVFRLLNIFSLDEVKTLYGLSTVAADALTQPWLLGLVMGLWILVPLVLAVRRFQRD